MSSPWLKRRMLGVTGTDVAAILGCHPFLSRLEVWALKTGRMQAEDISDREAVYWGSRLEPIVLEEYRIRTLRRSLAEHEWIFKEGRELLALDHEGRPKFMVGLTDKPHILCTPDDLSAEWSPLPWLEEQEQLDGPGVVEGKTTNAFLLNKWDEGAPLYHQIQGAYNATVLGASWFAVTGLIGGQTHLTFDYAVDTHLAEGLVEAADRFWVDHVLADVEPAVEAEADLKPWSRLHPDDNGAFVTAGEDQLEQLVDLDARLQEMKGKKRELEKEIGKASAVLKGMVGDNTGLTIPGLATYTLKTQERLGHVVAPSKYRVLRRKKA